ncbi:MAG TPA: hypothetical protein PKO06_08935 [Candidatus Ozemobacteraceae bacterium]|nr:hypothetical protein [Candidatus Ozemobacteraceae bacterium]
MKYRMCVVLLIGLLTLSTSGNALTSETSKSPINPFYALLIAWTFDVAELEALTRGYVSREATGIYSNEKYFEKDGLELRLLGMAHVADKNFYEDIKNSLRGKPGLILMEGVTDEKDLLETPLDLSSVAEKLGVDDQRKTFTPKSMPAEVTVIRADVDVSDFASDTIELLNLVGKVYSKKGFNFGHFLMMYLKLSQPEVTRTFFTDLIEKRNACLIGHVQNNLKKYPRIVIPWGAMHLPDIERWVSDNGFTLKSQKGRLLLRFPNYLQYILPEKPRKQG